MRTLLLTETKMVYKAFGLTIASELALPELSCISGESEYIDIQIVIDCSLSKKKDLVPYDFVVENQIVTVNMPDAGIFRIENGDRIILAPNEGADEDLIRLYVLGTCIGALLLQRGIYPLHGSAIAIDGKAYAFVGHSGAGKSTLASAFIKKGYELLSDDVIAVSQSAADPVPLVIPAYPQQKLWQQSLDAFGLSNDKLRTIYGRETKFCIPVEADFCSMALPLAGVFELTKTDLTQVSICSIPKLARLDILFQHTYRQFLVQKLDLTRWHFKRSAALAMDLHMYQLQRPTSGFTAPELVDLIINTISTGD
ncbi:aldolase [Bacillus sp. FJAT-28004]|uniref:aldolase n=1 Tax=Bacillus sp. FJAT-28004 TaxID=1679165 RepID=UPI002AA2B446|nr:aldolase [Bacillus sp. FJAT-28004]